MLTMKQRDYFKGKVRPENTPSIGYFGDSFCADNSKLSWCQILARHISHWPVHWGQEGSSVWHVFLTIEEMIANGTLPDTIFICYTEPYRIYHKEKSLTPNSGNGDQLKRAADMYRVYLQNNSKDNLAYRYAIQWFDQHVLKNLESKHKIIQMWSMDPKDIMNPQTKIKLHTGLCLENSILDFAYRSVNAGPGFQFPKEWSNHMTEDGNYDFAKHLYQQVNSYLKR